MQCGWELGPLLLFEISPTAPVHAHNSIDLIGKQQCLLDIPDIKLHQLTALDLTNRIFRAWTIRPPKWKHRSKHYVCFVAFCRDGEWLVAPGIRTHGILFPISSNCKHPGSSHTPNRVLSSMPFMFMVPNIHINNIESHMILTAAILTRLGYIHHTRCGSLRDTVTFTLCTRLFSLSAAVAGWQRKTLKPGTLLAWRSADHRECANFPIGQSKLAGLSDYCSAVSIGNNDTFTLNQSQWSIMGIWVLNIRAPGWRRIFGFFFSLTTFFMSEPQNTTISFADGGTNTLPTTTTTTTTEKKIQNNDSTVTLSTDTESKSGKTSIKDKINPFNRKKPVMRVEGPPYHTMDLDTVCSLLKSDLERGVEDNQVEARRAECGFNELQGSGGVNPIQLFIKQFINLLVMILLIATVRVEKFSLSQL